MKVDTNGTPYMQEIPKQFYSLPVSKVMIPINQQHVSRTFYLLASLMVHPILCWKKVLALDSSYQDADKLLRHMNDGTEAENSVSYQLDSEGFSISPTKHQEFSHTSISMLRVRQPSLDENLPIQLKPYSPTVIPIVKSKKSMVIVGAVKRDDIARSISRLKDMVAVASRSPVSKLSP
jgi:hypothetical protein